MHLGNASRHRRVEHGGPPLLHPRCELAARAWADRAHVDPDLRLGEAGEDPVGCGRDALENVVVGKGREEDVGGLSDVARRVAPGQTLVHELLRLLAVARFAVDGVSGGEEAGGHVSAHVPQADEAERSHDQYLSSMGVTSTTRCLVSGCSLCVLKSAMPQRTFSSGM